MDLTKLHADLEKALNLAAGTGILTQPEIDTVIQDILDHNNPLRMNLPRRKGEGESWLLNRKTAQTSGQAGTGGFVNDTEEPTDASMTRGRISFTYKTLLERGAVTTFMQAVGRSYRDLLADEINDTTLLMRDNEENAIINGDATGVPKQFDGLRVLSPAGQVVTAGGVGNNGAAVSLKLLDETIDLCLGRPNMMVMSKRTRRNIWSLLQTSQRFVDSVEVKGGFRVTAYAPDMGIYYSQYISDAQTQGTSGVASDLFVLDTAFVWMGVLEEARYVPLAKKTSQKDEFDVRLSEVLVLGNTTKGIARLKGLIPLP